MNDREIEDLLIRDLINSSPSTILEENIQSEYDPFEEHCCKGGMTETWLVPGGREFWLIFRGDPERFTWIEYCPYCGYRPPNLRWDWNNKYQSESECKIDGTSPVKNAYLKLNEPDE